MTPGTHLRAEILRLGLDQGAVANEMDVSRQTINNIVNDRQPISRSMAAKLGRLTGRSSDYWLRANFPDARSADEGSSTITADARPTGPTLLVNHEILAAVRNGIIAIDPFSMQNVRRAAIDLCVDDFVITTDGQRVDISDGRSFPLHSGQTVNIKTREWIEFPLDYLGRVGANAQAAQAGIIVSHAFQVDPGFKGYLQFCLFNAGGGTFLLPRRKPIISLEIMRLSSLPHVDADAQAPDTPGRRDDVALRFGAADAGRCGQAIREFIGRQAATRSDAGLWWAEIAELGIEMSDQSEPAAIASVTGAVLDGLHTLRSNPALQTPQNERYDAFVNTVAERLLLTREECQAALARLGLRFETPDRAIVALRSGKPALLHLPRKGARVTLQNLAFQLQERADDLLLLLTGQDDLCVQSGQPYQRKCDN